MKKRKENEVKEDRKPTADTLFVIGAQIYSYNSITRTCCTPLTVKKNLP